MKTIFLWWRAEDELSYSLKKEAALLPSGTTAEQLAYNVTFYVGLATEPYLAVGLLLRRHII